MMAKRRKPMQQDLSRKALDRIESKEHWGIRIRDGGGLSPFRKSFEDAGEDLARRMQKDHVNDTLSRDERKQMIDDFKKAAEASGAVREVPGLGSLNGPVKEYYISGLRKAAA